MHVAIDRENMGFLWAHRSYEVLLDMAHLEADCAVHVVSLVNPAYFAPFCAFTDLELRLLYENTTGEKWASLGTKALKEALYALALRLPHLDVSVPELRAQAAKVTEEYSGLYRYVKGAREPKLIEDGLFGVAPKRVSRSLAEEQLAASGKLLPQEAPPAPVFGPPSAERPRANTSAPPRPPRAPGAAAPRGGTRDIIWSKADAMWEAAGKPTSAAVVLALRKQIMNVLESEGIKRTSSSNELGNWQKARLAAPTT